MFSFEHTSLIHKVPAVVQGGVGGENRFPCLGAKQTMEFPHVLAG